MANLEVSSSRQSVSSIHCYPRVFSTYQIQQFCNGLVRQPVIDQFDKAVIFEGLGYALAHLLPLEGRALGKL